MRGLCVFAVVLLVAGQSVAQLPSVPGTTYGSQASQPFNEKVMFPNGLPTTKPPVTQPQLDPDPRGIQRYGALGCLREELRQDDAHAR